MSPWFAQHSFVFGTLAALGILSLAAALLKFTAKKRDTLIIAPSEGRWFAHFGSDPNRLACGNCPAEAVTKLYHKNHLGRFVLDHPEMFNVKIVRQKPATG